MATRLRVNYSEIEGLANEMAGQEKLVEDCYTRMYTAVKSLKNYMDGDSAAAYKDEFEQMLSKDIEALAELLTTYQKQLLEVCENFRDADAKIASMIF